MPLPAPIPSNVFSDGELVNEAKLYTRVWAKINALIEHAQAGDDARAIYAQLHQTAPQNLPNGDYTDLTSMAAEFGSQYVSGNRFVVPVGGGGEYEIGARVAVSGSAARAVGMVMVNNTRWAGANWVASGTTSGTVETFRITLTQNDSVGLSCYVNGNGCSTYTSAGQESRLYVRQVA